MNLSWIVCIFFFVCILALAIKVMGLQEKIDNHEKAILACVNERAFIFKADDEKDSVVVMCKRF